MLCRHPTHTHNRCTSPFLPVNSCSSLKTHFCWLYLDEVPVSVPPFSGFPQPSFPLCSPSHTGWPRLCPSLLPAPDSAPLRQRLIQRLLSTRHSYEHFARIMALNFHNSHRRRILLPFLFYRRGKPGTEMLGRMSKLHSWGGAQAWGLNPGSLALRAGE